MNIQTSEVITPAEYLQRTWKDWLEIESGDYLAWWGDEIVTNVWIEAGKCVVVTVSPDSHEYRHVTSQYTSCLRVERVDYAAWRKFLHDAIDKTRDDGLLYWVRAML
jgi:hypothetical protein